MFSEDLTTISFSRMLSTIADAAKPSVRQSTARPFIKWVGGKRSILGELEQRIPREYRTYHEPFLGGGALFFSHNPVKADLSDINFHLIFAYRAVRDHLAQLMELLDEHQAQHCKEYYLRARKELSREENRVKVAALFIYLNKTCYNGLYRVNKSGEYNVPMGDYKECVLYDKEVLRNASEALQDVSIEHRPFNQVEIAREDFFYFDPPYHKTYDQYSGDRFGDAEHKKLADLCREIDEAGAYFLLSNSDTPFVQSLFKGFTVEHVNAARTVSCKPNQRGRESELLISNFKN